MSNKLNGLTLNQAQLLFWGIGTLDVKDKKDKEDCVYLLNQLQTIINNLNEKDGK